MAIKLDERYFEPEIEYVFKKSISMFTKKSVKARVKLTLEELESAKKLKYCDFNGGLQCAIDLIKMNFK